MAHGFLRDRLRAEGIDETWFRQVLGALDVERDLFEHPLETFARASSRRRTWLDPFSGPQDLLIWTPMNYLDVLTRERIEEAILGSEATLLVVEHDRAFIDRIATEVIILGADLAPVPMNNELDVHYSIGGVGRHADDAPGPEGLRARNLVAAAAEVFAKRGYERAAMGEIATAAGVSTGNVYRYFPGKRELFDAAVPPAFVRRFRELLRRRVRALNGIRDVRDLSPDAPYHLASEELLRFCLDHRLRVIVLLARSAGSRYQRFAEHTVDDLVRLAVAHFESVDPARAREVELRCTTRFDLTEIYRAFVSVLVAILVRFETEASIREAIGAYNRTTLPAGPGRRRVLREPLVARARGAGQQHDHPQPVVEAEAQQLLGRQVVGRVRRQVAHVANPIQRPYPPPQELAEAPDESGRHHRIEQLALAREVAVDVAGRKAGGGGDLAHGRSLVAAFREHLGRRGDQVFAQDSFRPGHRPRGAQRHRRIMNILFIILETGAESSAQRDDLGRDAVDEGAVVLDHQQGRLGAEDRLFDPLARQHVEVVHRLVPDQEVLRARGRSEPGRPS